MTFKELLNSVSFEEVAPCLLQMHPDAEGNLKWYKIHFDMLRLMTPKRYDDANSDVCNITMKSWETRCFSYGGRLVGAFTDKRNRH